MKLTEFIIIVSIIGIILILVVAYLIDSPSWKESEERCENLSIQKNATSFIAKNFRDCILKFCEEVHSGNYTLLGNCYTEEWELEEKE